MKVHPITAYIGAEVAGIDRAGGIASAVPPGRRISRDQHHPYSARHPVVLRHPSSARGIVYVNESFTTRMIGTTEVDSRALLGALFEMVGNPRFQMRLRWEPGTVVVSRALWRRCARRFSP